MTRFAITIVAATALVTPALAQSNPSDQNIVQVAAKAGQFNTLLAAAKAADLAGALAGKGPFTVFAPTDAAFAKLGKATIADLLKPANKQKLADILKYHVVAGKVMSPAAIKLDSATTISGKTLPLSFDGKTLTVAGAKVVSADVDASNGVIHVVDSVMLPPTGPSIVDVAAKAGSFGTLLAAAKAAGLADTLGNGGPFTVFAPTDEAFAKLGKDAIADLLKPQNKQKLADILKFHVVAGKVMSPTAVKLTAAKAISGKTIAVKFDGKALRVAGAKVIQRARPAARERPPGGGRRPRRHRRRRQRRPRTSSLGPATAPAPAPSADAAGNRCPESASPSQTRPPPPARPRWGSLGGTSTFCPTSSCRLRAASTPSITSRRPSGAIRRPAASGKRAAIGSSGANPIDRDAHAAKHVELDGVATHLGNAFDVAKGRDHALVDAARLGNRRVPLLDDDVAAQPHHHVVHLVADTARQRHQRDDRSDADRHTQNGKQRPERPPCQVLQHHPHPSPASVGRRRDAATEGRSKRDAQSPGSRNPRAVEANPTPTVELDGPHTPAAAARGALLLGLVLIATAALYLPALAGGFCYDDRWAAMGHNGDHRHPMIAELRPLEEYFSTHYWRGIAEHGVLYRPITVLSFALRHWLVGDDALVAHLINVVLHLIATALVYGLLRGVRVRPAAAALGAATFGLHAIHGEAVVPVFGRAELLAFCGGAGALLLLVHGHQAGRLMRAVALTLAGGALFLGLAAKESALVWGPFAVCYAWARARSGRRRGLWLRRLPLLELAPLIAPTVAFLLLREQMLAALPPDVVPGADLLSNPVFAAEPTVRILSGCVGWGLGLLLTLAPVHLSMDWGLAVLPLPASAADPTIAFGIAGAIALAAVLLVALWAAVCSPLLFVATSAFLGFSVLTSNTLFPIGTIFAERLYYAPSLGLSFAVAWAAQRLAGRATATLVGLLVVGAWLGGNAWLGAHRVGLWRDDSTLILREAAQQPRSVRLALHAADVHADRREPIAALAHLERAVEVAPEHAAAWLRLAAMQEHLGRPEDARQSLEVGLSCHHALSRAEEANHRATLALLLEREGELRRALAALASCVLVDLSTARQNSELAALAERLAADTDAAGTRARGPPSGSSSASIRRQRSRRLLRAPPLVHGEHQHQTDRKHRDERRQRQALVVGAVADDAKQQRPEPDRRLPRQREQPVKLALAAGVGEARQHGPARRLVGAEPQTHQRSRHQERRHGRDRDRQHRPRQQQQETAHHRRLGAHVVVDVAKRDRAEPGHDVEPDGHEHHLARAHPERVRHVEARQRVERDERIVVEEPRHQEPQQVRRLGQPPQRAPHRAQAAAGAGAGDEGRRRRGSAAAHQHKQRQRKHQKPRGDDEVGGADVERALGRQPRRQQVAAFGRRDADAQQAQRQAQQAADVAERPAKAREPSQLVGSGQLGQEGVVEDEHHLKRDHRHGHQHERGGDARRRVRAVPGRLEPVPNEDGKIVLVDYAHTPDALEAVLSSVRDVAAGRVWVVFGCGGDRDAGKRPLMGEVAARLADEVVVTSDNPRSEDPRQIVDDILRGVDRPVRVEVDRARAIQLALREAHRGDVVVLAGKGHEATQEAGGIKRPFDDRQVARVALGVA